MKDKIISLLEWNGFGHGLATAGVMVGVLYTTWSPLVAIVAGFLSCVYWYNREAVARGTYNFTKFEYKDGTPYTDSKFDALTPIGVWLVGLAIIYGVFYA